MQITAVYDSSVNSAPAGFKSAVAAAINYFDSVITNNITVIINFGWGEINGQSIPSVDVGRSSTFGNFYNYSQVVGALNSHATSAADFSSVATLPAKDPSGGGRYWVADAEAIAIGLSTATSATGSVGLSSAYAYTFDPSNRAEAGAHDAIGSLEHEISEVLGRLGWLGSYYSSSSTNTYSIIDLFRYSPSGTLDTSANAYFSVDGGKTLLTQFNDPTKGGDVADWVPSLQGDSFGDNYSGTASLVTQTDLTLLDVLGYHIASSTGPSISTIDQVTASYLAIYRTPISAALASSTAAAIDSGTITLAATINNYIASNVEFTSPAIAILTYVEGVTPSSAKIDYLATQYDPTQLASYIKLGSSVPNLGPFEALGSAVGLGADSNFLAIAGPSITDTAFINTNYLKIFGVAPSTTLTAGFQAQINYFENLYAGAGETPAQAALEARGAILGQMFGYAFTTSTGSHIPSEVAVYETGLAHGTASYSTPLNL